MFIVSLLLFNFSVLTTKAGDPHFYNPSVAEYLKSTVFVILLKSTQIHDDWVYLWQVNSRTGTEYINIKQTGKHSQELSRRQFLCLTQNHETIVTISHIPLGSKFRNHMKNLSPKITKKCLMIEKQSQRISAT